MKEIELTRGLKAIVDDADFEFLSGYSWHAEKRGGIYYARGVISCVKRKCKLAYMHRLILCAKPGQLVDHKDGNGLNNQRSNIRICTHGENCRNVSPVKNATSKYLGVDLAGRPKNRRWRAAICHDGKRKHIGHFDTETEAAEAYNIEAIRLHGEFARINKITI